MVNAFFKNNFAVSNNENNYAFFSSVKRGRVAEYSYDILFETSNSEKYEALKLIGEIKRNGIPSQQPKIEIVEAMFDIAVQMCHEKDGGASADSFQILDMISKMGMIEAYGLKGKVLEKGIGIRKDFNAAWVEYSIGANLGDAYCQMVLALHYLKGDNGIKRNLYLAKYWLKKLDDGGCEIAAELLDSI